MNVNRTYSLPLWMANEIKSHPNQSGFVQQCVKNTLEKRFNESEMIADLTPRRLMAILLARLDHNDTLALLIRDRLNQSINPTEPKK